MRSNGTAWEEAESCAQRRSWMRGKLTEMAEQTKRPHNRIEDL